MANKKIDSIISERVQNKLDKILENAPNFRRLYNWMINDAKGAIVGGFVRAALVEQCSNDIDIVVSVDNEKLARVIHKLLPKQTKITRKSLGGLQFTIDGIQIDMWGLNQSYKGKSDKKILNLHDFVNTRFLNLEAIAFDLKSKNVFEQGCIKGMRTRHIEVICEASVYPKRHRKIIESLVRNYQFTASSKIHKIIEEAELIRV